MKKIFIALIATCSLFLSGCFEQPQVPVYDKDGNVVGQTQGGSSAGETALAAGGGAIAGTMIGNMLNRPSQPHYGYGYSPRPQTIIINKNYNKPRSSIGNSWSRSSRSSGFGSSRSYSSRRR